MHGTVIGKIELGLWLDLRETAAEVGREFVGDEWKPETLDASQHENELLVKIKNDIVSMIDSGQVQVYLATNIEWLPISSKDIHSSHNSFRFDKNTLLVWSLEHSDCECRFRAGDVRKYLKKNRHYRSGIEVQRSREKKFKAYLIENFSNWKQDDCIITKQEIIDTGNKIFDLDENASLSVRVEALKGFEDGPWAKRGRRPKTKK